jgi:hypothetical protein
MESLYRGRLRICYQETVPRLLWHPLPLRGEDTVSDKGGCVFVAGERSRSRSRSRGGEEEEFVNPEEVRSVAQGNIV